MESKKEVVIIDYGMGNLHSVSNACRQAGLRSIISHDKNQIETAQALILPGVGSFREAMKYLSERDLINPILEFAAAGKPLLGICLGMQLLFEESEEFGVTRGLGLIPGCIKKFPKEFENTKLRVPQIGWNRIYHPDNNDWSNTPLNLVENGEFMYFVHSFYAMPSNVSNLLSFSNYCGFEYCSSVVKENIFAMQFHPEKSALKGIDIYENFRNIIQHGK